MGTQLFPNYTLEKKPYLEINYWKIFKAVNKSDGKIVSAFIFEKKNLDKKTVKEKETILYCLRKEPETLLKGRNQHKNFLSIIQPLVEDNNSMGFLTEQIDYNLSTWLTNKNPTKIEIKYIIFQLLNVINFMQNKYQISHNNLNPNNIFLTPDNFVKIIGFAFTTNNNQEINKNSLNKTMIEIYCDLKYMSPEVIIDNVTSNNSDSFILGLISYYLLTKNDFFTLNDNTYDSYKNTYENMNMERKINKVNDNNSSEFLNFLLKDSRKRKNLNLIQNCKFFNDTNSENKIYNICLLSKMEYNELPKNYELLKIFPSLLPYYSKEECENIILPNLLYYLKEESLINPIVPTIFFLSEQNNNKINFEQKIWPTFKKLFTMKRLPAAALYTTLKKLPYLINNLSKTEFNLHCVPLICKALDCGVEKIQEVVLLVIKDILMQLDKNEFQTKIYPRFILIVTKTKSISLKKKVMNCLINLCDYFDSYVINNNFLDDIDKIVKAETTLNTCKNALKLYEKMLSKVNDKSVRSKIIPSLLLMMSNGEISEELFNKGENIIHSFIEKLKQKRKSQFVEDKNNSSDSEDKENIKQKNIEIKIEKKNYPQKEKSILSGNITLFEGTSEDSNTDLEEKKLKDNLINVNNIIGKNLKKNDDNKKITEKKIIKKENESNALFDNLLNDADEENTNEELSSPEIHPTLSSKIENKPTGKNINNTLDFITNTAKEFESSLKLQKIEDSKKNKEKENTKNIKISAWEEPESDDENTDGLGIIQKPKIETPKNKDKKNTVNKRKSGQLDKVSKKWDEDEENDENLEKEILKNEESEKKTIVKEEKKVKGEKKKKKKKRKEEKNNEKVKDNVKENIKEDIKEEKKETKEKIKESDNSGTNPKMADRAAKIDLDNLLMDDE